MKRGEVTMHEFEDERPIPLGRAAAAPPPAPAVEPDARPDDTPPAPAAKPASEPAPRPVEVAAPPVAATPPASCPDAHIEHIEKTREQAPPVEPATALPEDATPPVTMPAAEVAIVVAGPPVVPQPATVVQAPAAPEHAPAVHPMAALGALRFEVELVEPLVPVRDLGRFLAAYVAVAAFVAGLIVAFLALTHVGSGGA